MVGEVRNGSARNPVEGMPSRWPNTLDLKGSSQPCRIEGEVADMVVYGEIPKEIDGTFYRVMTDPAVPPHPQNIPLDGDGSVSAFRFHDGRVDMRIRYVETERLKLERAAGHYMFGLYRNPFSHHPCVRAAVDSTANTNMVYWADKLLALKEVALPYEMDPHTLDTKGYDPFGQGLGKTFSAHPKIDPYTNELVVYGYEAKGLGTDDIITYSLDAKGKAHDVQWVKCPWTAPIHDCVITKNFIVLVLWPFETSIERMKKGGHHWCYSYDRPTTFVVIPRKKDVAAPVPGWKAGEYRVYEDFDHRKGAMLIHTGTGWESEDGKELYLEASRVHDNALPYLPAEDGRMPDPEAKADYARFTLDLTQPTGSKIAKEAEVVLDVPSEFPRMDERFFTQPYDFMVLNVMTPEKQKPANLANWDSKMKNLYYGLDGLAMYKRSTGETKFHYCGPDSLTQEPIFIPRSDDAPEGDGWVICMVERKAENLSDLLIIDTRDFEKPQAIVRLPLHVKSQIHGNWIDQRRFKERKPLVTTYEAPKISGRGALEPETFHA